MTNFFVFCIALALLILALGIFILMLDLSELGELLKKIIVIKLSEKVEKRNEKNFEKIKNLKKRN